MSGSVPTMAGLGLALVTATLLLTYLAPSPHLILGADSQQLQQAPGPKPNGLRSPCPRAIRINTNYQYRGTLHFICLQLQPNSRPRLDVIQYGNQQLIWSKEVDEFDTNQLVSFVDDRGTLRILLAVPTRLNGTSMYSLDASGRYLDEKHTINTQLVSTMAVWRLELNWDWHLAIANQPYAYDLTLDGSIKNMRKPLPRLVPMITIHSWRSTYFDQYQIIDLPYDGRVNKIEPMHIYDQEFLIVAMESHNHDTNSLIYKLDYTDGSLNWVHYQYLVTRLALDASSFYVTHKASLQRDFYIALIGRNKPEDEHNQYYRYNHTGVDSTLNDHGLIIYKYFGNKFIQTNFMPVPGATKLDTISYGTGDSYVVIALMEGWSKQITLFLYDGLKLNPLPGPAAPRNQIRPRQPMPPSYSKYRRTIQTDGLHLFNVPPPLAQINDSNSKRTLSDDVLQSGSISLPALAFTSLPEDESAEDFLPDNETETIEAHLYEIPVEQHIIKEEDIEAAASSGGGGGADSGHTKRNYINTGQNLLGWCKAQLGSILSDNFDQAARQIDSLPRVDQPRPIEINGDLIIEGDLHISNLLYVTRIEDHNTQRIQVEVAHVNTSATFDEIERAHSNIDSLKHQVDQILVDDGTVQEVFTPLRFDKVVLECLNSNNFNPRLQPIPFMGASACPQVSEIRTRLLNNRDISDIQKQALLTGRAMRVGYDVRFEHLVLRGQTRILDTLNGIPINEIVFGRGQSTGPILGHKNFRAGLYSTANLRVDSWNSRRINPLTTLTSSLDQRIDANLKFNHVVLDAELGHRAYNSSSRIETLNGLHLDRHLDQIAQADKDNNFELPLVVDNLIINGPIHFPPNSMLSSINIEHLWASTMFKHSHQNVSAPMNFAGDVHVSYGGDLAVDGLINGVYLRPENVMMRNQNYRLQNPFVFEGDLNIRTLEVVRDFNRIQVLPNTETGRPELALLYDGGNQIVSGDKIFNEVHLGGRSNIETINGHLNLTQLYSLAKNDGQPFRFSKVRLSSPEIRFADNAPIQIESLINGIPVNDICGLATRLAQSSASQYNRLRFEQPIVFRSLRCAAINGFNNLRNSFLTRYGNQRVAGTLKLLSGVRFNSTVQVGSTFNNLNIGPLAKAINQVINESRTGHKDFYGDLHIDSLTTGRINDLAISSVFVANANRPQIVTAPMIFEQLFIENVLVVGKELITGTFDGLNVTNLLANTLQYDAPQIIYNHVEVERLYVMAGANLMTNSLNGHQLKRLYSDSVFVDSPQSILAPKTFRGQVDFKDRVNLRFGIDGLSEGELKFNLLLQSDELIEDDLEFNNDVTIMKSLEIQTGIINDVDVNLFVNSMLYENRPNGLRVLGNSSLRFKDVQLNNLVVTGTIQGIDLSRDAVQRGDNTNGSYDAHVRQQQIWNNNQQIFNRLYNTGTPFKVQTTSKNETYAGLCHIHSCPQTTVPLIPVAKGQLQPMGVTRPMHINPASQALPVTQAPPPYSPLPWSRGPVQYPIGGNYTSLVRPPVWMPSPPPPPPQQQQYVPRPPPPIVLSQQHPIVHLPIVMPRPMILGNTSIATVWKPHYTFVSRPTSEFTNKTAIASNLIKPQDEFALVDPRLLEYQARLKAQAIGALISRVNKYLSVSFYYEIVQKHPLLGPVLHAAANPIPNEEGGAWLLMKAANKRGEPCLPRGQTVEVMAQQRSKGSMPMFTVSSRIQETSSPSLVASVVAGKNHYLFIADSRPEGDINTMSHILVYLWDYKSGMYDLRERIDIDGFPTTLKAFVVNQQHACIALANPRVVQSNHTSGSPLLYCQEEPMSRFSRRIVLPQLSSIFDLDIITLPTSGQIVLAALSQQDTEQIGDLIVAKFDISSMQFDILANKRTARPLKLHFVARTSSNIQLVVSEGITSNGGAEATTRIYSLRFSGALGSRDGRLVGTQTIRDHQFTDIQSVVLDSNHAMVFFQSTNSISIYAPIGGHSLDPRCDTQLSLIQRLPTKGANKFLVFNNQLQSGRNLSATPFGHMLVLSKDDCEHQQYSTTILKPKFV